MSKNAQTPPIYSCNLTFSLFLVSSNLLEVGFFPLQVGFFPLEVGFFPLQVGFFPLQVGFFPLQVGFFPLEVGFFPLQVGFFPRFALHVESLVPSVSKKARCKSIRQRGQRRPHRSQRSKQSWQFQAKITFFKSTLEMWAYHFLMLLHLLFVA